MAVVRQHSGQYNVMLLSFGFRPNFVRRFASQGSFPISPRQMLFLNFMAF